MIIRRSSNRDLPRIRRLYERVAARPGGIARLENEISDEYIEAFHRNAERQGLELVAETRSGEIVAEMHAYTPGPFCFSHVLSELTIVVDPEYQGQGLGRELFERFLAIVRREFLGIQRVELIARESNGGAIRFYESLGFRREGALRGRIRNIDGSYECDIPMAWMRDEVSRAVATENASRETRNGSSAAASCGPAGLRA